MHLLQSEGILHTQSQRSKTVAALQNPGFPGPGCLLAYKKQFVLCCFLPCILMQAIQLPLPCRSDTYHSSYIISLPWFSFNFSPLSLKYVFSTEAVESPDGPNSCLCCPKYRWSSSTAGPKHTNTTELQKKKQARAKTGYSVQLLHIPT